MYINKKVDQKMVKFQKKYIRVFVKNKQINNTVYPYLLPRRQNLYGSLFVNFTLELGPNPAAHSLVRPRPAPRFVSPRHGSHRSCNVL
jgi:hypothetical protein